MSLTLFLASHAKERHVVYAHLSKAVETGKALWEPIAAAQDGFAWWGVAAMRPYMRALQQFADWHIDRGAVSRPTGRIVNCSP